MKKKYLITSLIILLTFPVGIAQTVLTAGDIVITGFNADNPDRFSFALMTDITATTTINFTDNGWFAIGGFRNNEGTTTWTATTDLTCGTEVIIESIGANLFSATIGNAISTNNGFALSVAGDQILAYQGPDTAPTFIYAINFSSFGWVDATSANDTALPIGLTDTIDAVDVGDFENGTYNCSITNDPALVLGAVSDNTNWILNNNIIPIGGCYYTCCIGTKTWTGIWTPIGAPTNTDVVIIDTPYSTAANGSFDACSLEVNANLNIEGTDFVQVTNDITINDGDIIVASEANLVQISDASTVNIAGTGVGVVQKTTTPLQAYYSYTYWSSPFVNEIIGEAGSGMDLVPADRIFEYDAANFEDVAPADGFDDNSDDWSVASGVMTPGRGYAAFAQNNGMGFPQSQIYSFDGQFNNGIITTPVTVSAAAADPNWNFLGNPYPSGLNATTFLTDVFNSTVLDGTIYLWTHNSVPLGTNPGPDDLNFSVDDYASFNPGTGGVAAVTGGTAPTVIIASGQGFFVEGLTSGVATFNNSMRGTAGNDDFFRATDRIWLNLENDYGAFSQILLGFVEGATTGIDRLYDGKRLDATSYISFFSLIDDKHYAIQGLEPLSEEETIPLGIKNLVSGENEYKISIDNAEGLLETSEVLLIDNLLNITHDLNNGEYVFMAEEGIYKERFELVLRPEALSINNTSDVVSEELFITKNPDNSLIFMISNGESIQNIQIFDVLGRQLYNLDVIEENDARLKLEELENAIFIAKATLENGKILSKKVLK